MRLGSLLVRADANSQIGTGHFMRCLALAQTWQEHGGTAIFLMAPGAYTLGKRLENENIREIRLSAQAASTASVVFAATSGIRKIVAIVRTPPSR